MGDLIPADGGRVSVMGADSSEGWSKLAYVFQSPRLAPWRTALSNVMLGMELRFADKPKAEMRSTAERLLALVGLQDDMEKYPGHAFWRRAPARIHCTGAIG